MKRSKEKLKNRKQNNSNKNTALKVLAASTLGLSILMSAPHVPDLMRYASVGVYNQDVSEYLYKSSANTLSSTSTGSTFDNSVVTGTGSGDIATGTGVTGDYTGSTLNESSLPSASTVTGNWNDSFEGKTYAELLALERDDGNILKSKGTEGEEDYRAAYTIYDANEFAFFSALVKANYTCNEIKNQTFKLGADIDLKGKAWKPVYDLDNNSTNIVNFDGAGYTISNAYVYDARNADGTNTKTYASIFGNWGVGYIKNLIIENANIQSWRSAAVVSNKRTDYSYASDYENITLKNCKVVAGSCGDSVHIYAVGISTNARYMTDCYMEGCEIIGTDTDVNLIGQELVNNVLNLSNTYHHVYGFGRARKVTNSNPEEKTVGIKNCKIAFESNAQNYDALTRSTSKYVYVCGISNFDQSVDDATYSNITVDNCEIYSDAKIGDATSASDALRYQNLNAYVYGVSKYGSSSTSIAVTLLDINVKNSKVYSSFDYSPTSENNKDMYFNFGTHVNGVSEVYTGNPAEGSTLYKNIVVENCDIYSSGDAEVITPQTNRRTNSYDTYNMNGRVSGLTSIETNSSKLENCSVKNCNVTASNKFKAVDDANYYINSSTDAYGMCISPNGRAADFVDCIVDNCNIFADSDLDNGTFAGDTDYHNPINQNTYAAGMGKGSFKSSKVTNCNIYTKSYDTKDTTVDKVGGWSGSTNAIGLGITRGDKSASVVDAVVDNCNITAESVHGSAIATGLTRQVNGGAYGFTITNSKLTNSTITAVSLKGNSHCTGLSLNDQTHTQGDASINITENTIDNVKMNFELTRVGGSGTETISAGGNTYGVAGLYNNSTVNNGITYNKNSFKNLSLDVNKLTGESYLTGGLYNTGAAKIAVSDNTVIDSAIHNKVTNATNNSHAYLSGLVYTTATKTTNDLTYIENNVCDNLDISNVVEGKTNIGHVLYTSGMIFVGGNTSAVIKSTNNVVKNSTIDTTSNVGNVYSFGMMALTYNRPTELSDEVRSEAYECYAYNNNVIANFNRGGSNATDKGAYAFGLTGWYVSRVRNCVVGSGSVNAHNDMTTAAACGVAATRGFGNGYSNRYNNTADNVYYTEIDNCYNFAEVKAETESSSQVSYAAGIGRAEIFTNCANYGNVTGNYAGGITTGYYVGGTSSTNVQSSFGLTIKNCVNAGNVCRANGGGQSFIGGIVARYEMRYYALHKFVLENNVSIGGVYSGYNETTGEYSQTLTSSTFMGMLYGQLSLPTDTSNYSIIDSVLDTISIRNNYMLVEEDGMNSGLYYAPNSSLDNLPVLIDTPHSPHIAATEGIFYQHQGNYKLDGTNNTYVYNKDRYKVMYSRCMGIDDTANSNTLIGTDYTAETFAKNSKYDTYYTEGDWLEWTMPSGRVPQVATTLEKLIVRYDIGDYVGTTPNVDIVDKTDTGYSYTLSNGRVGDDSSASIIDQVGVSLSQWAYDGVQYAPSYEVSNVAINGIVTYDAVVDYTNYYLELVNNNSDITISGVDGQVSLETTTKEITATGSDSLSVTAFMLQVKNADEWETLQVLPAQERQATFNLGNFINTEFLSKYATNDEKITIQIVAEAKQLHSVSYTDNNPEGEGHYSISATYSGVDAFTNNAPEGSNITIQLKADAYYEFTSVKIGGLEQVAENSTATTIEYTHSNITDNLNIEVTAQKIKYNVNVMFQNLQGLTLDSGLVDTLIENADETMSVDESVPALTARKDVTGYRFVGWKLLGMEGYLSDTNGTIDDGFMVSQADFARYTSNIESETKFNIVAVYQRQYQFNVALNNEYGESFASEYELCYVDENGVSQALTNVSDDGELLETGSYMIDESTFIQLKIKPNKRVTVVKPENEQFGNNIVYVYLTGNKNVSIDFAIRPLTITSSVLNVETPTAEEGLPANQLSGSMSYVVKDETGAVIGGSEESTKLNINNRVSFDYDSQFLSNASYRFVELRLLNVVTGNYDVVALNDDSELTVDDAFFENYVDDNGQVTTSMKVIKQYKAEIVGENLVSSDNYNLGSYTVEVRDEAGNIADTNRYVVNEANKSYTLDNGLRLVVKATAEKYAEFAGFSGMFDGEAVTEETATAVVNDNRSINLRFEKSTFTLEAPFNSTTGGSLEFTKTFQLGDTITISYTPTNNYQITDWNLAGKALEELGAVQNGNTITIKVTKEFLDAMEEAANLNNEKLTISSDIDTMMSPTLFYGIIGGGAAILILFGTVVLLLIRSKKLKRQKEENERKLNDIARKFNVADMIKDLKK